MIKGRYRGDEGVHNEAGDFPDFISSSGAYRLLLLTNSHFVIGLCDNNRSYGGYGDVGMHQRIGFLSILFCWVVVAAKKTLYLCYMMLIMDVGGH